MSPEPSPAVLPFKVPFSDFPFNPVLLLVGITVLLIIAVSPLLSSFASWSIQLANLQGLLFLSGLTIKGDESRRGFLRALLERLKPLAKPESPSVEDSEVHQVVKEAEAVLEVATSPERRQSLLKMILISISSYAILLQVLGVLTKRGLISEVEATSYSTRNFDEWPEVATPGAPNSGIMRAFAGLDHKPHYVTSAGWILDSIVRSASYTVFIDSNDYMIKALNGTTGAIDYKQAIDMGALLNSCLAQIAKKSFGRIFVRAGQYHLKTLVKLGNLVTIEGEGPNATQINLEPNVNGDMFTWAPDSAEYFTGFRRLSLNGNNGGNSSGNGIVTSRNTNDFFADHCFINHFAGDGIKLGNSWGARITNCAIEYNNGNGIETTDSNVDLQVIGGKISYSGLSGMLISSSYAKIIGVHIIYSLDGVRLSGTGASFVGCVFQYNQHSGLYQGGGQNTVVFGCAFVGNCTAGGSHPDLWFDVGYGMGKFGYEYGIIVANHFDGGGTSQYNVRLSSNYSYIAYNIFENAKTASVDDTGTGNVFHHNYGYATEANVLSPTFAIDSTGLKTITITHGLAITPALQDCSVFVAQNTAVADWAYDLLMVTATSSTTVTVVVNVSTASASSGATANIGLRVGKP